MKKRVVTSAVLLSVLTVAVYAIATVSKTTLYTSTKGYSKLKAMPVSKNNCSSFYQSNEAIIEPIASGLWNDTRIWPNATLPSATDNVVIPEGKTVTLIGTCRAKSIVVNGILNALKGQAAGTSINLETEGITISGANAVMEIGTETQPYLSNGKCIITLKGAKIIAASDGYKGIMVENGGTLDLHGKKKMSWTNLSATANINDKTIKLKYAVGWEKGDSIVLTSTALADTITKSWENTDKVKIEGISLDGKTITFNTPLKFKHVGGSKSYTRSKDGKIWKVDIQGEVGLLSHQIVIQSDIEETNEEGFGGHIMVMKNTTARVENVELYKMGQKGVMGKYPFHWHLGENTAAGDYFRNSSVRKSFNRAVTIHGTDYVTVDGIVAYDHIGHGIFLENGGERFNTIKNNLVFLTRRPKQGEQLTVSDNQFDTPQNRTPSSFWITNPNNNFENNVAAGTEGTGFWFAFASVPIKESAVIPYYKNLKPYKEILGKFDGFVAHTCMNGFDIFDQINEEHSIEKNSGWAISTRQLINNGLFYGNNTAIYCGLGNIPGVNNDDKVKNAVFMNCAFSDNSITTMLAADITLENCLFNADSDLGVFVGKREFFRFYDGPGSFINCHFEGWDRDYTYMIRQFPDGGATENFNPSFEGTTKGFSKPFNFKFVPIPNNPRTRARTIGQFFKDYDGGLTGKAHTTIIRDIAFLRDGHEYKDPSWVNAVRSDYFFASLWIANIDNNTPISVVRSKTGTSDACFYESGRNIDGTYKFPMIVNEGFLYTYYFDKAPETKQMTLNWYRGEAGELGYACFKGLGKLGGFKVGGAATLVNSRLEVENATNTVYFIATNGDVFFKLKNINPLESVAFGFRWDNNGNFVPGPMACTSNNFIMDLDGDGMSDDDENELCRSQTNAKDMNFEFSNTDEDFKMIDITANSTTNSEYWLLRSDKTNNPQIIREDLNFKGSDVHTIKIKAKSPVPNGSFKLSWTTINDPIFSESKSLTVAMNQTTSFEEMVFNLNGNPLWMNNKITKIKLNFPKDPNNSRYTSIDYIKGPNATNNGCNVTKVNEITETQSLPTVFPNPSKNGIFQLSKATNWKAYSVLGIELKSGNSNEINLSEQPKGVYLIKMNEKIERVIVE